LPWDFGSFSLIGASPYSPSGCSRSAPFFFPFDSSPHPISLFLPSPSENYRTFFPLILHIVVFFSCKAEKPSFFFPLHTPWRGLRTYYIFSQRLALYVGEDQNSDAFFLILFFFLVIRDPPLTADFFPFQGLQEKCVSPFLVSFPPPSRLALFPPLNLLAEKSSLLFSSFRFPLFLAGRFSFPL